MSAQAASPNMLAAALWYVRVPMFYVFPIYEAVGNRCSCGNPECDSPGKHPRTPHGLLDASRDEQQIIRWWTQWPSASIAINCGMSSILVVDHDVRNSGIPTHAEFAAYMRLQHREVLDTCRVLTGSGDGSTHDYYGFAWAEGDRCPTELEPGIELRGNGMYSIMPPSPHVSGNLYTVDGIDGAKAFLKLTPAPNWAINLIRNGNQRQQRSEDPEGKWTQGVRNDKLFKLASSLRGKGMTVDEITTIIMATNEAHCEPPLNDSEVAKIANSSGRYERGEQREEEEWPDPEPIDALPEVESHDLDLLPEVLQEPVEALSRCLQLPLDLPAVGMVAALAGATNRRVIIQPNRWDSDWTEVLNFWAMLIAAPGVGKSPLLGFCVRPLLDIEQDYRQAFEGEQGEYAREQEEHKLQKEIWAQQYKAAVKDGKTPPLRAEDLDDAPVMKRLITSDASYEKLHVLMKDNPAGFLLALDESTGWLVRLSRPEYAGERAFALSCWAGKTSHIVDRIGRGTIVVPHCCLSVLGAITPERLRSYLSQSSLDSPTSDGLMQRFGLAIWPEIPPGWTFPRNASAAASPKVTGIFKRLVNLNHESPKVYQFAPDAQELFAQWQEELMREVRGGSLTYTMQSHLAKYPKLIAALAALFELVSDSTGTLVSVKETVRALDWCPYLRSHAERIYSAEVSPAVRAAALLSKKICEHKADTDGVLEVRVVYRHHWEGYDVGRTQGILPGRARGASRPRAGDQVLGRKRGGAGAAVVPRFHLADAEAASKEYR
jgi:putative DNA primase/helicase